MKKYPTLLSASLENVPAGVDQKALNRKGFKAMLGMTTEVADLLVAETLEDELVNLYCGNDRKKRFNTPDNVINWQAKARLAMPIVRMSQGKVTELGGLLWMGPQELAEDEPQIPGAKITYAMRLYKAARGQGLAEHAARAMIQTHDALYGNEGVWLETWGDNLPAVSTYERVGFNRYLEIPGMRHGEPAPRLYMILGDYAPIPAVPSTELPL